MMALIRLVCGPAIGGVLPWLSRVARVGSRSVDGSVTECDRVLTFGPMP